MIQYAMEHDPILQFFTDNIEARKHSKLLRSISYAKIERLDELTQAKTLLNQKNEEGFTLLMFLAQLSQTKKKQGHIAVGN